VGIGPNAAVSVAKAPGDGITGAGPAIITTGSGVGNRLTAEKAAPNRAAFFCIPARAKKRALIFNAARKAPEYLCVPKIRFCNIGGEGHRELVVI
jgi:hypothetical protein